MMGILLRRENIVTNSTLLLCLILRATGPVNRALGAESCCKDEKEPRKLRLSSNI